MKLLTYTTRLGKEQVCALPDDFDTQAHLRRLVEDDIVTPKQAKAAKETKYAEITKEE